jgi:hypothetical protein
LGSAALTDIRDVAIVEEVRDARARFYRKMETQLNPLPNIRFLTAIGQKRSSPSPMLAASIMRSLSRAAAKAKIA